MTWFEKTEEQARHLVQAQQALQAAGLCDDPETVIELSQFILADPEASTKLRILAGAWERIGQPVVLTSSK